MLKTVHIIINKMVDLRVCYGIIFKAKIYYYTYVRVVFLSFMDVNVYDRICQIIANQLRADTDTVDEDADVFEDLGADSLDVVEILMAVEESFGVSVPEEDVVELRTARELTEYIESLVE
jgi:acyl carrier protein